MNVLCLVRNLFEQVADNLSSLDQNDVEQSHERAQDYYITGKSIDNPNLNF